MPNESGPDLKELQNGQAPGDELNPRNGAHSGQPKTWARIDRIRLLIWAGIGFGIPFALIFGLHLAAGRKDSVFSVQTELPIKILMVFFVSLATWIVSRMEKRSLDEYGIPLRQALGRRFWEGTVWGFGMLSAILLVLRASGHFQIDSVALTGGAVFRWALAWGATFLACH